MRLIVLYISLLFSTSLFGQSKTLLIARNSGEKVLADGKKIKSMGYATKLSENPGIPGPTLTYYEGDSVTIDLWNVSQGAPHTIHLHGLDVDQQNDGVPHLSFTVGHMEHGFYKFQAPHPGTYLYHCHVVSAIHVQGGMYGLLIVKPRNEENKTWSNGYEFVNDYNFLFSEIDTVWHQDSVMAHSTTHTRVKIPDYNPSYFLSNGSSGSQLSGHKIDLLKGSQTYVRVANIGYYGNRITWPPNVEVTIIDSDGRPIPNPYKSDTLYMFPGERYGVLLESDIVLIDSFRVEYLDMNTLKTKGELFLTYSVVDDLNIEDLQRSGLRIYPNPSNGKLFINAPGSLQSLESIHIYSIEGRLMHQVDPVGTQTLFDVSLVSGTYLIVVRLTNGIVLKKRVVIL